MSTFEIKVTGGLNIPQEITTNIRELDAFITEKETLANSLVVTDDETQVARADADAAEIAKIQKGLARFRIDFMRKWKAPVETFETTCKSYEKRLDAAAAQLRTKTAEVKIAKANAKRDILRERFTKAVRESVPEWAVNAPHFDQYFTYWTTQTTVGCWLNKTATDAMIDAAIAAEILRVTKCIETVEANYAEDTDETKAKARMVMVGNFDVSETLSKIQAWKEEQRKLAQAKAEAEERRRVAEEEAQRRKEESAKQTVAPVAPTVAPVAPTAPVAPVAPVRYRRMLRVCGTADQLRGLIVYMNNQLIGFEKIGQPEAV